MVLSYIFIYGGAIPPVRYFRTLALITIRRMPMFVTSSNCQTIVLWLIIILQQCEMLKKQNYKKRAHAMRKRKLVWLLTGAIILICSLLLLYVYTTLFVSDEPLAEFPASMNQATSVKLTLYFSSGKIYSI